MSADAVGLNVGIEAGIGQTDSAEEIEVFAKPPGSLGFEADAVRFADVVDDEFAGDARRHIQLHMRPIDVEEVGVEEQRVVEPVCLDAGFIGDASLGAKETALGDWSIVLNPPALNPRATLTYSMTSLVQR